MKFDAFVGGSNPSSSPNVDIEHTVNLYLEAAGEGASAPKARNVLYARPGLQLLCPLPASPVRGVWSNATRMFAVAGVKLFEIFVQQGTCSTNGTAVTWASGTDFDATNGAAGNTIVIAGVTYSVASYTDSTHLTLTSSAGTQAAAAFTSSTYYHRGDVGSDGLPVQIFPNGNQILIVSAGVAYCDSGNGPVAASFTVGGLSGTANISRGSFRASVQWVSGDKFQAGMAGQGITIGGTAYTVALVLDDENLTLTVNELSTSAYSSGTFSGTCGITHSPAGNATVQWISGDYFDATMQGNSITIAGTAYTVALFLSQTLIELTTNPASTVFPAYTCIPSLAASQGAFLDDYFIVAQPNSRQFNHSGINDGTSWDAADFFTKSAYPDNISAILTDHEELWLLGTDTTEVWQTTTNGSIAFERIPGAFIHHGSAASWAASRLQEGIAWLVSEPNRGGVGAVYAKGFVPTRISTHAVETVWNSYSNVQDAVSFTYIEDGHEIWVITFPSANATWAFDVTAGVWAEWGWWNGTSNDRARQMFHAFWQSYGFHVVGDWQNGNLYIQSTKYFTDNGTAIQWSRTAPHLSTEQLWNFYSKFQIDMEVGQSTSSPLLYLSWSDDGGHTWSSPISGMPSDATYAGRLMWWRLGRSRDRVFRVSGAVPTSGPRTAIIQALLDVQQGIG